MFPDPPVGLLAADLDGTLAIEGKISNFIFKTASRLRNRGIAIVIVTGRNVMSLHRVDGIWEIADEVIFSSGAGLLVHPESVPEERGYIPIDEVHAIREILDRETEDYCILDRIPNNHRYQWQQHREAKDNPDFHARIRLYNPWGRTANASYSRKGSAGDDDSITEFSGASQLLVIRPECLGNPDTLVKKLSAWSVFYSSSPLDHQSVWLEIFPKGVNKGTALALWCYKRGIARKSTFALGNDFNDVPMLRWTLHARVTTNAPEILKNEWNTIDVTSEKAFDEFANEVIGLFCS